MLSAIAADHVQRPRNRGELAGATHYGVSGEPGEGPYVQIWLTMENDRIIEASYDCHGCPASVAAASMVASLARNRTKEEAMKITSEDVLLLLGGLPEGKESMAAQSVVALNKALAVS